MDNIIKFKPIRVIRQAYVSIPIFESEASKFDGHDTLGTNLDIVAAQKVQHPIIFIGQYVQGGLIKLHRDWITTPRLEGLQVENLAQLSDEQREAVTKSIEFYLEQSIRREQELRDPLGQGPPPKITLAPNYN